MLEDIYIRYHCDLVRYLKRRLNGNIVEALDISQETYSKIANFKGEFHQANLKGLVFRIARNLLNDHFRSGRAWAQVELDQVELCSTDSSPEQTTIVREELAQIEARILALPPRCQEVFVLHRFEGMTYSEIAQRCGISPGMVEKHIQRALRLIDRGESLEGPK